jgi:hypothetical protein
MKESKRLCEWNIQALLTVVLDNKIIPLTFLRHVIVNRLTNSSYKWYFSSLCNFLVTVLLKGLAKLKGVHFTEVPSFA